MAKRGFSVSDAKSPSKKRAKSGAQARLDTFFNTSSSPVKSRPTQPSASSSNTQQKVCDAGDSISQPFVIDVDAIDACDIVPSDDPLNWPTVSPKGKGKEVGRQTGNTESGPLLFSSLDIDPVSYIPEDQPWLATGAPYAFLAYTFASLSQTRSRIAIVNILTNCLHTIIVKHSESLLPSLYLLSNTLAPPYIPVELGLGPSIISRAIQNVSGLTSAGLKRLYNTLGDPGDVAVSAKANLRTLIPHPPLTITYVYNSLLKIAHSKGQGATKQKEKIVEKLLLSASGEEVRYLSRTFCQNIRVGAVRTSMLTALARAVVLRNVSDDGSDTESEVQASFTLLAQARKSPLDTKRRPSDSARGKLNGVFSRAEALLKGVFVKHPNYDDIASALLDGGLVGLDDRVPLTIGIPLHPTLGSPMRSLDEVYERMGLHPFIAEFKYDGQRAQIHATFEDGQLIHFRVFSRHLEDMTSKYPDLQTLATSLVQRTPSVTSFIMDSEIVATDPRSGTIKSFQELSNRAKKDVQIKDIQVSVCLYAFDLMYLNGKILLQNTFRERRALLHSNFLPHTPDDLVSARFAHVESIESESGRNNVENFWHRSIQNQTEGLMVKLLDNVVVNDEENGRDCSRKKPLPATYEPDKRTTAWLKLKKDYVTGIGDSLDLVPIGAWYGNGRKVKWWSPILMSIYDERSGRFVAVCKCMSVFAILTPMKDIRARYSPSDEDESICSVRPLWECEFGGEPDVYFRPQEVWEIRGADITLSPISVAAKGLVSTSRGLSLRFPRFLKIRGDKSVEQASTPEFLATIWNRQQGSHRGGDGDDLIDVDFSAASELDLSEDDCESVDGARLCD
ncbi:DNA ligase 3 [Leucoagaricus sp. SymC.cos]|nr:DNA ligase 3 [Leucoagaricus sp. SymC.cos]